MADAGQDRMRPLAATALPAAHRRGAKSSFQSGRRSRMLKRRLAATMSAVALALGATTITTGPAQAVDPECSIGIGHYQQAGAYITAYRYKFCDGKPDVPLGVSVQRYMSPGVYQTVASGFGEATYYCGGFAYGVFRAANQPDFAILCT
jgi:hypothetical protein